jgi:DNA-binding protein HU-beta
MPMAKMMTKSATFTHLAQKTNLTKKQVAELFDAVLALANKEAKNGFVVPGFGKLVLANRKARMGRNPQTGEPVKIKASKKLAFRQSAVMKAQVMGGR